MARIPYAEIWAAHFEYRVAEQTVDVLRQMTSRRDPAVAKAATEELARRDYCYIWGTAHHERDDLTSVVSLEIQRERWRIAARARRRLAA